MWDASKGHDSFFMPPTSITVLDLSAYVGLLAVGATLNMLLGLLMAYRYSPHRSWPHRRFNYFRLHKQVDGLRCPRRFNPSSGDSAR